MNTSDEKIQSNVQNKYTVVELFKQSNIETDNVIRSQLENKILKLSENIPGMVKLAAEIMQDPELVVQEGAILALIVFIKNNISLQIENRSLMDKDKLLEIMISFLPIFECSGRMTKKIQDVISTCLNSLLKSPIINTDFEMLNDLFKQITRNAENEQSIEKLSSIYLVVYNCMNSNINNDVFLGLVGQTKLVMDFMMKYITDLLNSITSINSTTELDFICRVFDLKKNFFEILFLVSMKLKKLEKLHSEIKDTFINCYLDFAINTIQYESQNRSFISFTNNKKIDCAVNSMKGKAFMWISMLIQYDGNDEIFHPKLIEKSISLFSIISEGLKYLVKNHLDYLSKMNNLDNDYTDNEYNSVIFQANLFLSRILIREPMVSTMMPRIKEFVFEIIIPMIMSTQAEYLRMKTEGEQHHTFNIDILGDFADKSYKTSVTFVLYKLTEKYDGLTNYLITSICNLIEYISIGGIDQLRDNPNTEYSLPFLKEFVLQNKEAMLIDTCFFLLNSLCKNFNNSKHFKIIKKTVLKFHREFMYLGNNSEENYSDINKRLLYLCKEELVLDKISFFLGLYAESLFLEISMILDKNPIVVLSPGFEEVLKRSIHFLFNGLMNYNICQGTSYQCCFSLKALLSISILKPYYDNYFGNVFDKLILGIKEIELYPYFDLLIEIMTRSIKPIKKVDAEEDENDPNKLANQIAKDYLELTNKRPFNYFQVIEITKSCVDRILKEIKSNNQNLTILSKCLNILIILSESYICKDDFIPESDDKRMLSAKEFEVLVSSITSYMKNPSKINFDTEIVDYVSNAQKKSSELLESTLLIYDNLERILIKNQNITKGLYDLIFNVVDVGQTYLLEKFNSQVNNNTDIISQKANCFDELVHLLINEANEFDSENSTMFSILILQKLLHTFSILPQETVKKILEFAYTSLKDVNDFYRDDEDDLDANNYNIIDKTEFYKLQLLISLINSVAFYYQNYLIEYIYCNQERFNEIKYTIDQIYNCRVILTHPMRVALLGNVVLLNNDQLYFNKQEEFLFIFKTTINLLTKQKKEESDKLKIVLKKDLDCNFLEENNEEDDDDNMKTKDRNNLIYHEFDEDAQLVEESLLAIREFRSPFSTQDEFANFNIIVLKYQNETLINEYINGLNSNAKENFINIVKTKRHKAGKNGALEVVRNTLRIRRKLIN